MGTIGILLALVCFIVSITPHNSDPDTEICIRPGDTRRLPCSGRGDCVSKRCICGLRRAGSNERYSGKYCECDDYSCPYDNLYICGGNGRCICGVCECYDGFDGPACELYPHESCIASNGKLCNGTGECQADGTCKCDVNSPTIGPTCEEVCLDCEHHCWDGRDCAECVAFGTGPYDEKTCMTKCKNVTIVDELQGIQDDERYKRNCQFQDRKYGCWYHFTHAHTWDLHVRINVVANFSTTNCNPPPTSHTPVASYDCLSVVLGVLGGLILPWISF